MHVDPEIEALAKNVTRLKKAISSLKEDAYRNKRFANHMVFNNLILEHKRAAQILHKRTHEKALEKKIGEKFEVTFMRAAGEILGDKKFNEIVKRAEEIKKEYQSASR